MIHVIKFISEAFNLNRYQNYNLIINLFKIKFKFLLELLKNNYIKINILLNLLIP